MKKTAKQDAWISMDDYVNRGVRKPKSQTDPFANTHSPPPPERWVPFADYTLHGVRKKSEPVDECFIQRLKPSPPPTETPPEAYLTIFDALQEVWSVPNQKGTVFSRLESIRAKDRAEWTTHRISDTEYTRRQTALDAIREQFAADAEAASEWFLNHRFRLFETLPNA